MFSLILRTVSESCMQDALIPGALDSMSLPAASQAALAVYEPTLHAVRRTC